MKSFSDTFGMYYHNKFKIVLSERHKYFVVMLTVIHH